jgi:hypothetical protein
MTATELEEFYDLQNYILSCRDGDRPMSPAAAKLERYFELKDKLHEERCKNTNLDSKVDK